MYAAPAWARSRVVGAPAVRPKQGSDGSDVGKRQEAPILPVPPQYGVSVLMRRGLVVMQVAGDAGGMKS